MGTTVATGIEPTGTTLDIFRNLLWIATGGLVVGTLIRHGYDAVQGVPDLADSPLVDFPSILLGASLILLWLLVILASTAMLQNKPWVEAKEHWGRWYPDGRIGFYRTFWLCCRSLITSCQFHIGYFIVAFVWCYALTAGEIRHSLAFFGYWCLIAFGVRIQVAGVERKWFAKEPDVLGGNIVRFLNLPDADGRFVVGALIVSFIFGASQYPKISQSFGGGRPEQAVVFLKSGQSNNADSQTFFDGKVVNLVFRRGSKLGFRNEGANGSPILVVDQEQIDHLYVGHGIEQTDLKKLK